MSWLIPILTVLALGAGASWYLHKIRLPREETQAGISALAGMRWRDYMHLVLAALNKRGYERTFDPSSESRDESDYQLERDHQTWLLSSKHGTAFVLGSTAIAEFANTIRMRGAAGGLLVTSGHFAPEAKPLALAQRIELLDGPALWPELKPLMHDDERAAISAPAQARAKRHVVMAWIGSLVLGVALFLLLRPDTLDTPAASATAIADAKTPPGRQTPSASKPAAQATASTSAIVKEPTDMKQRRDSVAESISTLPDVDRALWSTQSTLLVYMLDDSGDPKKEICPLLERYDELAASRIQLQPPANSTRPVRFIQCRYY